MKTTDFTESGMTFSFPSDACYRIEHSPTHQGLGEGVKICECVAKKDEVVLFIEAKTSIPKPGNTIHFNDGMQEIIEKFRNSILLYAGLLTERPYKETEALPPELALPKVRCASMKCYLLVKNHEDAWLPPVTDALRRGLMSVKKTFAIEDIIVLNAKHALKHHLIQAIQP